MKAIPSSELRTIQLSILKHVDAFCSMHKIKYFLCGGTLIGAVRHQGYIPWDDDIDIMMLRPDYERFVHEYRENDNSCFSLHVPEDNDSYYFPYAKIDDTRTELKENVLHQSSMGVNIDLFPIDVVPEDIQLQSKMYGRLKFLMRLMQLKTVVVMPGRSTLKNLTLMISHVLLKPVSMKSLVHKIVSNATRYSGQQSECCGIAVWGYGMREVNKRSNWDDEKRVPFEDMMAPIPVGYDNYLRGVYGDYMQLPPEEKRITHHDFEAWWV